MANQALRDIDCAVAQSLSVIGDWWSLLILRESFSGTKKFDDFLENLGISTSVLSSRLKALTNEGIFVKQPSPEDGRSFEYVRTPQGNELYPVIIALFQWGEKHYPGDGGERAILKDKETLKPIKGVYVLSQDGKTLQAKDVVTITGPGASDTLRDQHYKYYMQRSASKK